MIDCILNSTTAQILCQGTRHGASRKFLNHLISESLKLEMTQKRKIGLF